MIFAYERLKTRRLSILLVLLCSFNGCASAQSGSAPTEAATQPETCEFSPRLQSEKSAELLRIVQEDQADRAGPVDSIDWSKIAPRDLARRIKVASIFAKGCFKSAADYASAAMVFQHGAAADHFYQTFIWANKAVQLGDESQRWLTAAGIDRYLVKIGQKQLFGTQFSKDPTEISKGTAGRWCLQPVEPSFPESRRIEYIKINLKDNTAHVLKGIGATQTVEETKLCEPALKASPRGTVPGFW